MDIHLSLIQIKCRQRSDSKPLTWLEGYRSMWEVGPDKTKDSLQSLSLDLITYRSSWHKVFRLCLLNLRQELTIPSDNLNILQVIPFL